MILYCVFYVSMVVVVACVACSNKFAHLQRIPKRLGAMLRRNMEELGHYVNVQYKLPRTVTPLHDESSYAESDIDEISLP